MSEERRIVEVGRRGVTLANWDDVKGFARAIVAADMVPYALLDKSGDTERSITRVAIVIESGLEMGLAPMTSMRGFAVINNMPAIYGAVGLGVCQSTGRLESVREWYEVEGQAVAQPSDDPTCTAFCEVKARDWTEPYVGKFSVAQAVAAGFWKKTDRSGKPSLWVTRRYEMLMWKARWRGYRVPFAHELNGVPFYEEAIDYEPQEPRDAEFTTKAPKTLDELVDGATAPESAPDATEVEQPPDDEFPKDAPVGTVWEAPGGQPWVLLPTGKWEMIPSEGEMTSDIVERIKSERKLSGDLPW